MVMEYRPDMAGEYMTLEHRPDMAGGLTTLPVRPGGPADRFGGPFDRSPGEPHGCPSPEVPFERGFDGPGESRHRGPGRPPRGGIPPFGRPPCGGLPDADHLKAHIDEAGLAELLMMAARLMPRRPGAGSARGQNLILSILAGRESMSQRELQQMLAVQPGSLSEIVTKLERKGFVCREKGEDRRGNLLSITEEGRRAIPQALPEPEDELFEALDADQRTALQRLLRTLLTDWAGKLSVPHAGPERDFGGRFMTLEARADDEGKGVRV